ncbi:hypothetical protein CRM22_000030 [Opisthorchis felineus]|uniref:BAR domain-containing protein n=1 Tax=Opisthorchis felineus TaxID=147828 RepID=A0A4S2MP45_OPIFE|nr:hypothetical protein CRM22_000030 [Opisthorchis felineus]
MSRSSPSLTSLTVSEDDPGIFLELTEGKIAIGNEIKSNISRLILKVYEATDACGKLLESLVRFLDPTWDGTGSITSVTADVQAALNDLLNRLNKRLDVPMDAYIEQYRKLKPHVRKWKDCATQFSRKSKAYEQTRRKYKEHPKTEHARLEAISAQAESEHEGKVISWKLKKLNNAGVIACCKTWFVLLDSYTKLVDKMPPIINRLQNNVYILHDQASHNMLPEWRSTASEAGLTSVLSFPKRSSLPAVTVDHRPNRSQSATLAESKNDSPRLRDITPSVLPLDWDPLVSKGPLIHEDGPAIKIIKGHFGFRYNCSESHMPSPEKISLNAPQQPEFKGEQRQKNLRSGMGLRRSSSQVTIIREFELQRPVQKQTLDECCNHRCAQTADEPFGQTSQRIMYDDLPSHASFQRKEDQLFSKSAEVADDVKVVREMNDHREVYYLVKHEPPNGDPNRQYERLWQKVSTKRH